MKQNIIKYISQNLKTERLEHSFNVAKLAVELAGIYGVDLHKAELAGLLHDCAKNMSDRQQIDFFKKCAKFKYFKLICDNAPQLLHSFVAEIIAGKKFKIKDRDVLNAIRNHTLGRPKMSLLEKIVFVADSVSLDRKCKFSAQIRKLAKKDLDVAFIEVLKNKIGFVLSSRSWICPQTIDTWNYYAKTNKKSL